VTVDALTTIGGTSLGGGGGMNLLLGIGSVSSGGAASSCANANGTSIAVTITARASEFIDGKYPRRNGTLQGGLFVMVFIILQNCACC
jgi:hypothetical protein